MFHNLKFWKYRDRQHKSVHWWSSNGRGFVLSIKIRIYSSTRLRQSYSNSLWAVINVKKNTTNLNFSSYTMSFTFIFRCMNKIYIILETTKLSWLTFFFLFQLLNQTLHVSCVEKLHGIWRNISMNIPYCNII